MHNNSFFKSILFLASILLFVSCDKEYSAVGDTLIGDNHFDLNKYTSNVVAYNEKITPIQSNNLPVNALGIYDNPAFGKTNANFVTQLTLAAANPVIGANPVIDSVYVDVPYFSTLLSTDTSGNNLYKLDSIYGEAKAKIKLSIYESGRYMGAQNGNAQVFYTDQNAEFNNLKIGNRLNDDASKDQNDEFFFDPKEHKFSTTDATTSKVTVTRTVPSMRLKLNVAYFDSKIIHAPTGSLTTNDVFINYFKGLYFKVEQSGSDAGSLAMMNFAKGTVTIKYKEDLSTTVGTVTTVTRADKSIVLNMSGSTASLLDQSNTNANYTSATTNPNRDLGDDKLYLKGGEGSLAVIDLFGPDNDKNGVADELETIRKNGWLINEANLVFNIDTGTEAMGKIDPVTKKAFIPEPERVYLYDYTNNTTVLDYYLGASVTNKLTSKYLFGGYITKDATSKRGVSYKINITNHIRNLVKYSDVKNIKLGVVVTEDINAADMSKLKTSSTNISQAPKASVMNPLGTILFGGKSTSSDPLADKRLKLEIYYTKPN
jgi:hypothetical protein